MINRQWLELPKSRTNFYGSNDVRANGVRLYMYSNNQGYCGYSKNILNK